MCIRDSPNSVYIPQNTELLILALSSLYHIIGFKDAELFFYSYVMYSNYLGKGMSDIYLALNNFLKDFIYLFLDRREGRKKEREKHQCMFASCVPPTRDLAVNPGMCPDWESNK